MSGQGLQQHLQLQQQHLQLQQQHLQLQQRLQLQQQQQQQQQQGQYSADDDDDEYEDERKVQLYGAACRVLVNHQFKDLFGSASELLERMQNENVTPPFMYASMVAAEDRLDFLEAMTKYLFGRTKEVELNQIVKIRDSMDVAFLAVIRLRVLTIAGGAYLATMLSVAPAPSSKYIRGGNRDGPHEGGLTWLGLNEAEGKFRLRPPAPPLTPGSDAGKDLENCNVEIERPIYMQQHSHQLQQQQQQQQQPLLAMESNKSSADHQLQQRRCQQQQQQQQQQQ
eukprot:evm.model.NODE_24641_length_6811_cov_52.641022.3